MCWFFASKQTDIHGQKIKLQRTSRKDEKVQNIQNLASEFYKLNDGLTLTYKISAIWLVQKSGILAIVNSQFQYFILWNKNATTINFRGMEKKKKIIN